MITLHAFGRVNSMVHGLTRDLRVQWALEELGLPYQVRGVDRTGLLFKAQPHIEGQLHHIGTPPRPSESNVSCVHIDRDRLTVQGKARGTRPGRHAEVQGYIVISRR